MRGQLRAYHERSLGDGVHVFVASTAGAKRDGLLLEMGGGHLDHYTANPVFLWAHDYRGQRLPIGRTEKLQLTKTKLRAQVRFDLSDPFAVEAERKYAEGYLNAVSVGWMPIKMDGPKVLEWDLLDISGVPVPGDPDALIEREMALLRSLTDPDGSPEGEAEGDDGDQFVAGWGEIGERTTVLARKAIPPHTTEKAPEDTAWDGPAQVAACPAEEAPLRRMHSWVDPDIPPEVKRAYKLPHHEAGGRVVWRGVAAAMARLFQSATDIPTADREGVYNHLARHYRQFEKTPPELRDAQGYPARVVAGMFHHGEWDHLAVLLAGEVAHAEATLEQAKTALRVVQVEPEPPKEDPTGAALAAVVQALKENTP